MDSSSSTSYIVPNIWYIIVSGSKGGQNPYIGVENLLILISTLKALYEDCVLQPKSSNIIQIASKSKGWLGFIDVYNEEIVIYDSGRHKKNIDRISINDLINKSYPKPTKTIQLVVNEG